MMTVGAGVDRGTPPIREVLLGLVLFGSMWMFITTAWALPPYAEDAATSLEVSVPTEVDPFAWSVESAVIQPGSEDQLTLRLVVPEGHTVYRDQLAVTVLEGGVLTFGEVDFPVGERLPDPADLTGEREVYPRDVLIYLPVTAPADLVEGVSVTLELRHQGCRTGLCFSPVVEERELVVAVRAAKEQEAATAP